MKTLTTTLTFALVIGTQAAPKAMPAFKATGTDGKTYTAQSFLKLPTIIVFLGMNCPHNPAAIPVFNRLQKELKGKAQIVAFINSAPVRAKAYAKSLKANFPFLSDPESKTMIAFGANHSLDLAYVADSKRPTFVGVTDGYDRATLTTILRGIRSAGRTMPAVNLNFVPVENQSGCGI